MVCYLILDVQTSIIRYPGENLSHLNDSIGIYRLVLTMFNITEYFLRRHSRYALHVS